jgi:hypothetical protein
VHSVELLEDAINNGTFWTKALRVLVLVYIVLSAAYIVFTQFTTYQTRVSEQAFLEGRRTTIEQLIEQAEASCEPFAVFADEKQIELVNVECLLSLGEEQSQESLPVEP